MWMLLCTIQYVICTMYIYYIYYNYYDPTKNGSQGKMDANAHILFLFFAEGKAILNKGSFYLEKKP